MAMVIITIKPQNNILKDHCMQERIILSRISAHPRTHFCLFMTEQAKSLDQLDDCLPGVFCHDKLNFGLCCKKNGDSTRANECSCY